MEAKISRLAGVEKAQVNFLASLLILEAPEEEMEHLEAEAEKIIRRIEPGAGIRR